MCRLIYMNKMKLKYLKKIMIFSPYLKMWKSNEFFFSFYEKFLVEIFGLTFIFMKYSQLVKN